MRGSPGFAPGQFGGLSRAPRTRMNPASSVSLYEHDSALPPGIVHQEKCPTFPCRPICSIYSSITSGESHLCKILSVLYEPVCEVVIR